MKGLLSVLIVHYNTPDLLRQCLASLTAAEVDFSFEIIVIDNASPDASVKSLVEEFPRVDFHFNERNLGFARANNQGIKAGRGRYFLLLNPDACIDVAEICERVTRSCHLVPGLKVRVHDKRFEGQMPGRKDLTG